MRNQEEVQSRTLVTRLPKLFTPLVSVPEKITVRSSDADATKWLSISQSFQTWCLHAVLWPESLTSWQYYAWLFPIWNPWGALATPPQMGRISPPFLLNRSGFLLFLIHWIWCLITQSIGATKVLGITQWWQ